MGQIIKTKQNDKSACERDGGLMLAYLTPGHAAQFQIQYFCQLYKNMMTNLKTDRNLLNCSLLTLLTFCRGS